MSIIFPLFVFAISVSEINLFVFSVFLLLSLALIE